MEKHQLFPKPSRGREGRAQARLELLQPRGLQPLRLSGQKEGRVWRRKRLLALLLLLGARLPRLLRSGADPLSRRFRNQRAGKSICMLQKHPRKTRPGRLIVAAPTATLQDELVRDK